MLMSSPLLVYFIWDHKMDWWVSHCGDFYNVNDIKGSMTLRHILSYKLMLLLHWKGMFVPWKMAMNC